ncbi:MAG TPA: hybrid sensor histidine kinase/response regulator [Geothrix sp.]|uniref:hybrid sensor histidine kinase/response regulator n=1 Tax=Geothrix mesophila TaxID=2922723 RepID=UPI001FAD236D|nr:hybrid sensor histidine kinase/response regulator [Geothrix sp. SG198]HJV38650.1 hybrid sensor histidine kinase/response regulator [Geothrix sp.]
MLVPQGDILIVDDNAANLDLLGAVLRERQYRVRAVPSGAMALAAARRHPPELVMLDVNMPGMDGYETCEAFKQDPVLARIPIIFISALDDPLDKVRAFRVGGRDYVTKPFSAEEVLVRVEHQVNLGRLQRELEIQNQNLLDANFKLKEVNTLKTNFTTMLVHDLRSPLTVLGLVLERLREGSAGDGALDKAEASVGRIKTLLDEMLEIYRSESGQLPMEFGEIDPGPWLKALMSPYPLRAASAGLEFQVAIPEGLPTIRGDVSKLDRVLVNLVDNAFKFTPRGGAVRMEAGVEFGSGVEAGLRFLRLSVIDTGRGIPAGDLPYIFDPFRQSERSDASKGVGLGLAIVQRLVAAHKGQIRAQSQVGFGSSFSILLPC